MFFASELYVTMTVNHLAKVRPQKGLFFLLENCVVVIGNHITKECWCCQPSLVRRRKKFSTKKQKTNSVKSRPLAALSSVHFALGISL